MSRGCRPGGARRGRPAFDRGAARQPPGQPRAGGSGRPRAGGRGREGLRAQRGPPPVASGDAGDGRQPPRQRSSAGGLIQAAALTPVAGGRVSLPPRTHPRRGLCRDHKGATSRPARAPRHLARAEGRGGRARRLSRRAGTPLPARACGPATRSSRGSRPGRATGSRLPGFAHGSAPTLRRRSTSSGAPRHSCPRDPSRAKSLCELAIALRTQGHIDQAKEALQQAIEDVGETAESSSAPGSSWPRSGSSSITPHGRRISSISQPEAIPLFEELGDDRALGRAWVRVAYVRGGLQGDNGERAEGCRAGARSLSPLGLVASNMPQRAGHGALLRTHSGRRSDS